MKTGRIHILGIAATDSDADDSCLELRIRKKRER
jgi:hypothetical protein